MRLIDQIIEDRIAKLKRTNKDLIYGELKEKVHKEINAMSNIEFLDVLSSYVEWIDEQLS